MIDPKHITLTRDVMRTILAEMKDMADLPKDEALTLKINLMIVQVLQNQVAIMEELNEIRSQMPYKRSYDCGPG